MFKIIGIIVGIIYCLAVAAFAIAYVIVNDNNKDIP